jgi:hypothetical protein
MDHVERIKEAFDDLYREYQLSRLSRGGNGELRVQKLTPIDEARIYGNIEALVWVLRINGEKIDDEVWPQETYERLSELRREVEAKER